MGASAHWRDERGGARWGFNRGGERFAPEWRVAALSSSCGCYFASRRRVFSIPEIETESSQG
eukprot:5865552-Pleurochrysis_carterae.AAC.1